MNAQRQPATLTVLGSGTSVGVPTIGCPCAVCHSTDPRDNRLRPSVLLRYGGRAILVDTTPDLRAQALRAGMTHLDAIIYTHAHADHIFGFDDIRRFNTIQDCVIPAYAVAETLADVKRVFNYIGNTPSPQGLYRPLVDFIEVVGPFAVGDLRLTPLEVQHGKRMTGYLLENGGRRVGYVPDCHAMPAETVERLRGVDVMILDALRYRPHPTHICVQESLDLLARIGADRSYLIHLCHDVDHARLESELPPGVQVSYDGLRVRLT